MHKEFEVHMLTSEGLRNSQTIATLFNNLLCELESFLPARREFSIVKTKLEEACFFAKKAMASDIKYQKDIQE